MPDIITPLPLLALWALLGYLIGAIPFGVLISRALGLGDLRAIGSGNIGATNVLRTGSKPAAAATLLLDGAKGAAAVLAARAFAGDAAGEDAVQLAGLAAFIGHCFPVWLGFKGGKGVATFLGLLIALAWPVGLAACASWLAAAAIVRMSSGAALFAAALSIVWALLFAPSAALLCALLAALVFWRHAENIRRIIAGTEPQISAK
jgi:glycerol-3-phosphate acyltransferase PlsY